MAANDEVDLATLTDDQLASISGSQLRDHAASATRRALAGDAAVKELAIVKAGVDTTTELGQMFLRGYDGKLDDPETIKAAAVKVHPDLVRAPAAAPAAAEAPPGAPAAAEAPPGAPAAPEAAPGTPTAPVAGTEAGAAPVAPTGTEQRTNLADGAVPAGAGSGDVRGDSIKHAEWAREQGGSRDDAMAIIISDRAAAAMKDPSVRLAPDGTTPIERANPLPA